MSQKRTSRLRTPSAAKKRRDAKPGQVRKRRAIRRKPTRGQRDTKDGATQGAAAGNLAEPLTGAQRRHLRALAHALKPVVQVGQAGLTESVLKEIEMNLKAHELIKVRVSPDASIDESAAERAIQAGTGAQVAQHIGHVLVVYRRHPTRPKIELPIARRRTRGQGNPSGGRVPPQ